MSTMKQIELFKRLRENQKNFEEVMVEAERCKAYNMEMLRSYGVEI